MLSNLELTAEAGQVIGILGKNGAGKTTLFEAIYQNIQYQGQILWKNQNLRKSEVAYLETEHYFYPYITGEEYLSYFFFTPENELQKWLNSFQLPLKRYVQEYSTGMKKKLALLGILALNQPVIILDEPFNGVDFEGVHHIYEMIKEQKQKGKLILMSSHIVETLFHTCDAVAILKNGHFESIYSKEAFNQLSYFSF
ncbi:ATP-binding cassette domain-containing protein [Riemerella columbina]|uniref:ATP-binding cassette domain-containing protein n=1 Tax=Riemerella columbina TaxID=103810 RepID=UPI00266F2576|nr:ATP-binding cassette domain-containing protein [Riemerella columbina]WKS95019.1 ATP-binding cassette domain-containing protein [Riemerella columbina]